MIDFNYGDHTPKAPHEAVREISEMINEAGSLEERIDVATKALGELQDQYNDLVQRDIPNKMKMCGLEQMTTEAGFEVTIKKDLFASIPSPTSIKDERDPVKRQRLIERRFEGFAWLKENGYDRVINHEVRVKLGKGQDDAAQDLVQRLRDQEGLHVDETVDVHHQTLRALFKQLRADKKDFPVETFGVFDKAVAKVSKK